MSGRERAAVFRGLRCTAVISAAVWLFLPQGGCEVDARDTRVNPLLPDDGDAALPMGPAPGGDAAPGLPGQPPASGEDAGDAALSTACIPGDLTADCPEVVCAADDVCQDFPSVIAAGTCVIDGRCATPADCPATWTPAARGGEACACEAGVCALALREPCQGSSDCDSGACAATALGTSICCALACSDEEVCSEDGASCVPGAACTDGDVRCSGSSYQRCAAGRWTTQTECGALGCNLALGGCLAGVGQPCASSDECGEGACLPTAGGISVCCTAPCDVACRACDPGGTACENLDDDDACGTIACPADDTCRNYPPSVASNRCTGGRCGAGSEVCSFTARGQGQQCSAGNACDGAGNCSVPRQPLGSVCGAGNQCASGFCVDGVCCDEDCNGACETCAQTGVCRAPASDASCPVVRCSQFSASCAGETSDVFTPQCLGQGRCQGLQACEFAPTGLPCFAGVGAGSCDGQGSCVLDPSDPGPISSDCELGVLPRAASSC